MRSDAFTPNASSAALAVTSTSTATPVQVNLAGDLSDAGERMIQNAGTKTAWLAFGASTIVAVAPTAGTPTNGIPILAGAIMIMRFPPYSYFAAISDGADTTTLYITPGRGN